MVTRAELKQRAKASLTGHWQDTVIFVLLITVINLLTGIFGIYAIIAAFAIGGPLSLSAAGFFLRLATGKKVQLNMVLDGFYDFVRAVMAMVAICLVTFAGLLLCVIPGIILAFGLSQVFFILYEDKRIDVLDALKKSWDLMRGHKFDYFVLALSFLGWIFLCILTVGLGTILLAPYMQTTIAHFYLDLKNSQQKNTKKA